MKSYTYHFMDTDYQLGFFYNRYVSNGNLYIGLINTADDEAPYFGDLTINITGLLPFYGAVDDELDSNFCNWLESIGAGRTCNEKIESNYGEYPQFAFSPEFLQTANPESYALLHL